MAIKNYKCIHCDKIKVCKVNDILAKIADESDKKNLGVTVTMEDCENYSSTEE
jgi:hypothetical protein